MNSTRVFLLLLGWMWTIGLSAQGVCGRMRNFASGFAGSVYRTDADMFVHPAGKPDEDITLAGGLKYRLLKETDGELRIKLLPLVKFNDSDDRVEILKGEGEDVSSTVYTVQASDLEDFHRVWQQGLTWSALLLPVKFRGAVTKDSIRYEKDLSTDIAIGPFFGYKFAAGKSYEQFCHIGIFAGPSLINTATVVSDSTLTPVTQIEKSTEAGFSFGWGVVYEMRGLQIGFVRGKDEVFGATAKTWPYSGQWWWSFAIGYSFLTNQR